MRAALSATPNLNMEVETGMLMIFPTIRDDAAIAVGFTVGRHRNYGGKLVVAYLLVHHIEARVAFLSSSLSTRLARNPRRFYPY